MSHKCGSGFRRKQTPTTQKDCPSCGSAPPKPLPDYIIDRSGRTRKVASYLKEDVINRNDRWMITEELIKQLLDNWLFKCITPSKPIGEAWTRWSKANFDGKDRLMQVVTNKNDSEIFDVYPDRDATKDWQRGIRNHFNKRCKDGIFEERR